MEECFSNRDIRTYIVRYKEILRRMITQMNTAPVTNSISHNFIVRMLPHHRAAIEMSRNILNYTKNPELISIAQNIITEQTESISNMQDILCSCSSVTNDCPSLRQYNSEYKTVSSKMFCEMRSAPVCCSNNINFIREMIPHHCGAVKMSESALDFKICESLVPVLQAIITSQTNGIKQMSKLLNTLV